MTLLELLVKELPKHGGWPDGMQCACQSIADSEVYFYRKNYSDGRSADGYCDVSFYFDDDSKVNNGRYLYVTHSQYQSALAASQKPAWNGEGLPPVGCECEWHDANVGWLPVTIKYISEQIVVMASPTNLCGVKELTEIAKDIICDKPQFRPLSTEEEKKRDDIVESIFTASGIRPRDGGRQAATDIYDAIAAGKIPGVKLED